jgi:hypothetical protein
MRCLNCHRASEREICDSCWAYAFAQLPKFAEYYQLLETELLPRKGFGERVSGSKTPPMPVSAEVLALRAGGISNPLMEHEAQMRELRQETKITFRGEEVNKINITSDYIIKREDWIYNNYDNYPNLIVTIIKLVKKIHSQLGWKSNDMVIGYCPALDEQGLACGSALKVNPQTFDHNTIIRCRICDASWSPAQWSLLGRVLAE